MESRRQDGIVDLVGRITHSVRGRIFLARTNAAPWRCVDCGGANHAATTECHAGCGERDVLEVVDARDTHEPVTASGSGRTGG